MKPLHEYETPLTDAELNRMVSHCGSYTAHPDHARDLERKLALCRDALDEMESVAESNTASLSEEGQITMNCIIEIAADALEATK